MWRIAEPTKSARKRGCWLALMALSCLAIPSPATAGTYTVTQTCGVWDAFNNAPAHIAIYTECPGLVLRNVGGPFNAAAGQEGRWDFNAPPGALIERVFLSGSILGGSGWQATMLTNSGEILENCPGATCAGGGKSYAFNTSALNTPRVMLRLRCGADSCPNGHGLRGYLDVRTAWVTITDSSVPALTITGGDLLNGWRRGTGTVTFDASDNVGIRLDRILVDGTQRGQILRPCVDGVKIPCPNGGTGLQLDSTRVSDGPHTLRVESVDSAGNVAGQDRAVSIDNTAPAAALEPTSDAGDGWRAVNAFSVSWRNPRQAHAPIAGTEYELCRIAGPRPPCSRGSRNGAGLVGITDLRVPSPGAWRLRLWLRDAAGNHDPTTAVESVLRFDDTPPTAVFLKQGAGDPTRLRVEATDGVSGVGGAEIEARRRGTDVWAALPVERTSDGFSARLDDEVLPRGVYELRARVVDLAGNERSTTTRPNGRTALVKLPVRAQSGLVVGRPGRLRCSGRGPRRRCVRRLAARPSVAFGRSTRFVGRLRSRGKRLAGVPVEVWSQTQLDGAPWRRVAVLTTTRTGHVRFRAKKGPARVLRFRYPGTATRRGATALVDLRVRASSSMRPSSRNVVNGEYVTFRGRLRGQPMPTGGKLVELQVYTRRRWRTFAQPRARARTGRWAFQYRFESIRGRASFKFRARIRREAGYPFHTGVSRSVRVRVRGL